MINKVTDQCNTTNNNNSSNDSCNYRLEDSDKNINSNKEKN